MTADSAAGIPCTDFEAKQVPSSCADRRQARLHHALVTLTLQGAKQQCQATALAAWVRGTAEARQSRREALFDAMGRGMRQAEGCRALLGQRMACRVPLQRSLLVWRAAVLLLRQQQQLRFQGACQAALVASHCHAEALSWRILLAWHSLVPISPISREPADVPQEPEPCPEEGVWPRVPGLWSMVADETERRKSQARTSPTAEQPRRCPGRLLRSSSSPRQGMAEDTSPKVPTASSAPKLSFKSPARSPTRVGALSPPIRSPGVLTPCWADIEGRAGGTSSSGSSPQGVILPEKQQAQCKGPERFFYDTTSYTGCARFGGPTVVDRTRRRSLRTNTAGSTAPVSPTEKKR